MTYIQDDNGIRYRVETGTVHRHGLHAPLPCYYIEKQTIKYVFFKLIPIKRWELLEPYAYWNVSDAIKKVFELCGLQEIKMDI